MKIAELSCNAFVKELALKAPTPGGGGASACVGAMGMALGNMVGSLTVGKKKYAEVEEEIIQLQEEATKLQEQLLELIDKDAEVFLPLAKAYSLPSSTEEEKEEKARIMEGCLVEACSVPLEIMEVCCKAIDLQEDFARKGSRLALSDAGVGVTFCKAALEGASLNVFINTGAMKNRAVAKETEAYAEEMLTEYRQKADSIFKMVKENL